MKVISLKVGQYHTIQSLIEKLVDFGYEKVLYSEIRSGEFFSLGGVVRIFPVSSSRPILVEYFGDQIEIIKAENVQIDNLEVLPNKLKLNDGSCIASGDYIVHEDHGIGIFSTLEIRRVGDKDLQYIKIFYLNEDKLLLPVELTGKLSSYIGVGRRKPRLSKLGSQSWAKAYKKTYENVLLLAKELLAVYAQRSLIKRPPLTINNEWDKILITDFPHKETSDQLLAIKDIFNDLQKDVPMDRLICGDVGLGKTEVAMRAIAQVIANGFQVALMAPTTILAEQHYLTMKKRFKNLPISIARLSRLVSMEEAKKTIEGINNGSIDLIIGTHKLLNKDIKFKRLHLLVIDEEQKFGVKDKEKIKNAKNDISILMITATPIPRTLFMSLSGLRDVSQINTVPMGRQSIETSVIKYDKAVILSEIKNELDRHGQVYYLHNQVKTLSHVKSWLQKNYPESVVEMAHGQMPESRLAQIMNDFMNSKIDILACSTIIENGLDLPSVNTLIVDSAEKFGLPQLHQIRGRVGRGKIKAKAVFMYSDQKLTENAIKRFKSLSNYSDLGAGFNIALSDLEIRGGGNILGKEQHGNMEAVGLVLYTKLLEAAVKKLREKQ